MRLVWFVLAGALLSAQGVARADDGSSLLDGSTNAIIMGPTWVPDPNMFPGYIPTIDALYLEPLGFSPTGHITALTTPETLDFGPSIATGDQDLINAVEADYNAGDMSPSDPLTIVGYSQSTVIESQVEPALYAYGIPSDDLRFVMLGDAAANPPGGDPGILGTPLGMLVDDVMGWQNLNGTVTPDNLYPTDVFTVNGDFFSDPQTGNVAELALGMFEHGVYLGLPESAITGATPTVDGLTTYYDIADPSNLVQILLDTALNNVGL